MQTTHGLVETFLEFDSFSFIAANIKN